MRWFTSGLLSSFGDFSLGDLVVVTWNCQEAGNLGIAKQRLVLQVKSCVFMSSLALKRYLTNYPTPAGELPFAGSRGTVFLSKFAKKYMPSITETAGI